jgi:hypothetical protein
MNDIGTQSPYFSFLLCAHPKEKLVNAYVNGQAIGSIKDGVFSPHAFAHANGVPTPIRLTQMPKPFPFADMLDMKRALHAAIDKLEIIDEETHPIAQ